MNKKNCHRCLMVFTNDGLLVLHLKKKVPCEIINDKYSLEYENELMIQLNNYYINFEIDLKKYLIILESKYQCQLCNYITHIDMI